MWKVDLGPAVSVPDDTSVLSPDERARAARFLRPADRARSIASRTALRELLARYSGEAPAALRFVAGRNGKPALDAAQAGRAPRFNVAHSGRIVLLAFAACDVCVDVEAVRSSVEAAALARRFFSPDERAAVSAATPSERDGTFFRIWSRKEAFLKAHGLGLSASLPGFTTTSPAGTGLASVGGVGEFPAGHLLDVEPGTGYVGAVVTSRPAGLASWHLEGYPPLEEIPS